MLIYYSSIAALASAISLLIWIWIWRILKWVCLKPWKVEKLLREQGFRGKSYRLLFGDVKENAKMNAIAMAKPCNFTNDIVPRILPFDHHIVETFGKKSFKWVGARATVLVMDPELVKEVLAKHYVYQKIPIRVGKNLIRGVAFYDTHKWSKHRKLINPAFHLEKLKLMLPAFDLSCSEMLSKWEKIVPLEGRCELDVEPYLQTLTSDAISRTAFGSNFEEGRKIFELQRKHGELGAEALQSIYIPGMRFLPTKRNRVINEIYEEIRSAILTIINKRMKAIERGEPSGYDLLGILLESNLKEIQERGSKFGMSFGDVIEECKLFYFAGQETTSTLLTWTLILLAKHQDWQDRARAEILQIFNHKKPDFEGLNRLKIVTMIFNETLRLYPPIPTAERVVHEDTKLGEILLPAKTELLVPAIMLQHDENLWGVDAKEFNPQRFSDGVSKATNGQHIFFPFSSGPRVCIGQNFAMIEAKMALAQILQRFSFEMSPSYTHSPHIVITLQPQHGAQLILRRLF